MGKKANVMITLPPEIVKKARELGLNISKISENALKEYIKRLQGPNPQKDNSEGGIETVDADWWGRPDLNRGPESPSLVA